MPFWHVDSPHLALPYVGGMFQQAGWQCRIADLNVRLYHQARPTDRWWWHYRQSEKAYGLALELIQDPYYRGTLEHFLRDLVADNEYDLFAFTVNYSSTDLSLYASRLLKPLHPGIPVLFGGPECFPLADHTALFSKPGAPHILCQGEAETCFPKFLKELGNSRDFRTSCRGFVYMDGEQIVDTGAPELPTFQDGFVMPAWEQIDFSLYRRPQEFSSFLSRGCVGRCAFCSEAPTYQRHRCRKPEDLIAEIKQAIAVMPRHADAPTISLMDSLINGNMSQLDRLCTLMIDEGMQVNWTCEARLRPEMTRPLLQKMRKAGCTSLLWGLESASQKILDLMRKDIDYKTAKRIIIDSAESGITNLVYLMVGFPGETASDFVTNVMAVRELRDYASFDVSVLNLSAGSPLQSDPGKWGVQSRRSSYDWVTDDLRNDFEVREIRGFLLRNAAKSSSLSLHGADGLYDILELDFNRMSVASEIAAVLFELWKVAGVNEEMTTFLTEWQGKQIDGFTLSSHELQYWSPTNIPAHISLRNWFGRGKNSREQKLKICLTVLAAIRGAHATLSV